MWDDPIVAEVRKFRDEHAARFNYDIDAIVQDFQESERNSNRPVVSFAPKRYPVSPDRGEEKPFSPAPK